MSNEMNRREFVKTAAAAGVASSIIAPAAMGANERIRVGFIGIANRGGQLIKAAQTHERLEIVALCDVDSKILAQRAGEVGGDVAQYTDFRKLLERDDIDAVLIATPDHWHAIQTIQACEAGKDVYVEKPLSMTIHEGRKMVEAARRTKRIVQVGLHRRASELFEELHQTIQSDYVGKVTASHAYRITNMAPNGIGHAPHETPPDHLDWDMWLGPRAAQPYQGNIAPYKFRWWNNYSSQMGNWGVHYFDLIRWLLDEEAPSAVCAMGGRFAVDDDRTIPDTAMAVFEFASGRLLNFGQFEASGHAMLPAEIDLRGTKGIVYANGKNFEIIPEKGGQFQDPAPRCEPMKRTASGSNGNLTAEHIGEFLDCIKSRELPRADVEVGHKSTVFCHLANISLATKSRLEWDSVNERITNNEAANELLHYEYREPWTLG